MEPQDLPPLYQASDTAAIRAQRRHYLLTKTEITLLVIIALTSSFPWNDEQIKIWAAIVSVILLLSGLFVGVLKSLKKFDHIWFRCRAIAEAVETESWLFEMKVGSYYDTNADSGAEVNFIESLKEILSSQTSVSPTIVSSLQGGPQITDQMRQLRAKDLKDRKEYYIQNRIGGQMNWYTEKSKWNHEKAFQWFLLTWFLQFVAVIIAVIIIYFSHPLMQTVGIITTAAAGAMSWKNSKNYSELSQSYSLVAQRLLLLEPRANQVTTEGELSDLILEVERIINRERTMWFARRLSSNNI